MAEETETTETTDGEAGGGNATGSGAPDTGGTDPQKEVEKWKSLARKHEAQAKANAKAAEQLKAMEDQGKSELERATTAAQEAASRAAKAELAALQLDVALEQAPEGMTVAQVRKLAKRLAGTTREELEADAEELFAEFAGTNGDGTGGGKPPVRTPQERLRSGGSSTEPEPEPSTDEVLAKIPRL